MATGYNVSIGVIDNVTKPIDALNKRIAAMNAPMERLGKSLSRLGDNANIAYLGNAFKDLAERTLSFAGSIARALPGLSALTAAGSIAGVFKLSQAFGDAGNRLSNTSAIVGTSVTRLSTLENAARMAGASAADMDSSLTGLNQTLQDAASGKNREAASLFQQYGVEFQAMGYQGKNAADKMGDAFEIIKKMKDAGKSAGTIQDAMSVLHISPALTRMAMQGREGLRKYEEMAKKYSIFTPEMEQQSNKLYESFLGITMAAEGFGNKIMERVSPSMSHMLDFFSELILKNRDWISLKIGEYAERFGKYMESINWEEMGTRVSNWGKKLDDVVGHVDGLIQISKTLFELWLGAKALSVLGAIGRVATAITGIPGIGLMLQLAALGAAAETSVATKGADEAEKARQMGLEAAATDDAGHVTSYRDKATGQTYTPDEVDPLYKGRGGQGPATGAPAGPGWGRTPVTSSQIDKARREAWDFWKSKGLTDQAAAGMVAQEQAESGFNPGARGDYNAAGESTAAGSFQWHGDRRKAILEGAKIDVTKADANQQREAMWWEMQHPEAAGGKAVMEAKTPMEAGREGSLKIERPGLTQEAKEAAAIARGKMAQDAYNAYHTAPSINAPPAPTPVPANTNVPAAQTPAPANNDEATPAQKAANGTLTVHINHNNPPTGASIMTTQTGNLLSGPPTIVSPMTGFVR